MSGELANLNKARKAKAKSEATAQAKQNRVRFGLAKSEKARRKLEAGRAKRELDGLEREEK